MAKVSLSMQTPPPAPPSDLPRSALLDWAAALRRGFVLPIACAVIGGAIFVLPATYHKEPALYRSVATLVVEPDTLERELGRLIGLPVDRYDRASMSAQIFERAARSPEVLGPVLDDIERDHDGDYAGYFGFDASYMDDRERLMEIVRGRHLAFEYEIGDLTIRFAASASSAEFAREFATAVLEGALKRYARLRRERLSAQLRDLRGRMAQLEKTASAENESPARERLEFLREVEEKYLKALEMPQPALTVLSPPSAPTEPTPAERYLIFWSVLGAATGLAAGLLWIALKIHREAMARLNPEAYGVKSDS